MNSSETEMPERVDKFILMWDIYGLESIINVSELEREEIMAVLADKPVKHTNLLQVMLLRARFNSQRCYEIYAIESELTKDEIQKSFTENPQVMADTIRERGKLIYSDYVKSDKVVIR